MKILCEWDNCAPGTIRTGWARVFAAMGHNFTFWDREKRSAFDAFNLVEPDIYIGTTYNQSEATCRCIKLRPHLKVAMFASAWGSLVDNLDRVKYPIVYVTDEEKRRLEKLKRETGKPDYVFIHVTDKYLEPTMGGWRDIGIKPVGILNGADTFSYLGGIKKEEYSSDIGFVGNKWPYKSRNLDKFLGPLLEFPSKYKVKIWGGGGWQCNQYLGQIDEPEVKHVFASTKICPNISESHSTDLKFDIVERVFKAPLSGFLMSDNVDLSEVFPEGEVPQFSTYQEFVDLIEYYLKREDERCELQAKQFKTVMESHSYFNRVWKMLKELDLEYEANRCLKVYMDKFGPEIPLTKS